MANPKANNPRINISEDVDFDPAMMSLGAKDRVSVHIDEQTEATMRAVTDIKKSIVITRHALVAQLLVAWTAEAARRNMPDHSPLFDSLEFRHHQQLCQIRERGVNRWDL